MRVLVDKPVAHDLATHVVGFDVPLCGDSNVTRWVTRFRSHNEETVHATHWTAVFASLSLVAGACVPNAKLQPEGSAAVIPPLGSVTVIVTNNTLTDMDIYSVVDEANIRIGLARGLSSTRFTARPSMFSSGVLRLVAAAMSVRGFAQSEPLHVRGGQLVTFTIQPNLEASFGTVR